MTLSAANLACVLHIAQDKYGKSFEDCDSKERQSVGGTKVCCCAYIP